ncbi:MAG TPA: prepilin peptidase [Bacillus bacterium]|uniref:prepilin peptidase n=1 Tax=Siminovitchia fordii TaxID=254759 RepID=UPI00037A1703|nr:A24 family peptidase [Siminovitchia fordii]HBZ09612.1 prepilin peptidase [Bacillus sp. (in: firmicutes)]
MAFIIFIYGLLFGSFFNVAGLRIPLKQSVIFPESACPHCEKRLSAIEMIPVISFLVLGGKCRYCKVQISPVYPAMELLTACLFTYAFIHLGWTNELIIAWTLISLFMIITVSDITYMLIPDKVLLAFSVIFLLERIIEPLHPWWSSLAGAATGFGLLLFIAIVSKGAMGGGDIKLFAVLGFAIGTKVVLLSFFLATLIGAIAGGIGMMVGSVKKGEAIPFGPFIATGTLFAYFYHEEILLWYFGFL